MPATKSQRRPSSNMQAEVHNFSEWNRDREDEPVDMTEHVRNYREFFKQDLITAAAQERDWAFSYRGFHVGASVMTMPGDGKRDYSIFTGHNFKDKEKPSFKGSQKKCGERAAVGKAIDNDAELIVAMVTVSKESSTGDAHEHDALHPCADCRAMLRALLDKGILRGDSIMCNVNDSKTDKDGKWVEEERTVDQLLALYEDEVLPRASGF